MSFKDSFKDSFKEFCAELAKRIEGYMDGEIYSQWFEEIPRDDVYLCYVCELKGTSPERGIQIAMIQKHGEEWFGYHAEQLDELIKQIQNKYRMSFVTILHNHYGSEPHTNLLRISWLKGLAQGRNPL